MVERQASPALNVCTVRDLRDAISAARAHVIAFARWRVHGYVRIRAYDRGSWRNLRDQAKACR